MSRRKKKKNTSKFTEKDPSKELDGWISQKEQNNRTSQGKPKKASQRLSQLKAQRRRSVIKKLVAIFAVAALIILGSVYYMSPISNVSKLDIDTNNVISQEELGKFVVFNPQEKVLIALLNQNNLSRQINESYPSVAQLQLSVTNYNELKMKVVPANIIGYFQVNGGYQKIIENGRISPELVTNLGDHIIYFGYQGDNQEQRVHQTIDLVNKLPDNIKKQVAKVRVDGLKQNQIIFVMKDQNIILGSQDTIIDKIQYYSKMKDKLESKKYLIDLEVGYFAQPLSEELEKNYNNSI